MQAGKGSAEAALQAVQSTAAASAARAAQAQQQSSAQGREVATLQAELQASRDRQALQLPTQPAGTMSSQGTAIGQTA